MNKILLVAVSLIVSVCGSGEVTFISYPESISFKGNEAVDQSLLKEIYSASLGFTTNQDSDWSGLQVYNPFHYAEALVTLVIDGIEDLVNVKGHHFAMNTDEDEDVTWMILEQRVRNRFPAQNSTLMRVELSEGIDGENTQNLGEIEPPILPTVTFLDTNVTEDRDFVSEVALLQEITKKVQSGSITRDGIPDVYWFVLRGLHAVWDLHGDESLATEEAKQLLIDAISEMNYAFNIAYNGRVLVSLVTSDVTHTRQIRSAAETEVSPMRAAPGNGSGGPTNLADDYDEMFPIIFNICLWLMILLLMAVISISIAFIHMDPGKDSIIYRMTNMKSMKKEN